MNKSILFVGGFLLGAIITAVVFWSVMPGMMLNINESKLGFEETVAEIEKSAIESGWMVPKIYNIQASLQKAGFNEMTKLKILSICQPTHAFNILNNDDDKKISAIMPCRISVYEDTNGNVFIGGMNNGLMSKMFGGNIAKVMGGVAEEEHNMLKHIIK